MMADESARDAALRDDVVPAMGPWQEHNTTMRSAKNRFTTIYQP
jgi:hypothetical protein